MTVGSKIRKGDYNSIQSTIAEVLGVGSGNFGYGQTVRSSQVNENNKVTVTQWANLKNDIISCYLHIDNAAPEITQAILNTKVRSNSTNSPYTQYVPLADAFLNDAVRMAKPPVARQAPFSAPLQQTTWPGEFGNYWRNRIQSVVTVTWSSANAARHFFNTGGEINFLSRQTGGSGSEQTGSWRALLLEAGTQTFGGRQPGTGTGASQSLNGSNFYRLDNSFRTWYDKPTSNGYANNSYRIQARAVNAPGNNNSNGGATSIQFRVQWNDDYINDNTPGSPDRVDGTIELAVSTIRATGTLSPSGVFTIENPAITVGKIEPVGVTANATYQVTPRSTSVNEGSSVTFDVATTNIPNNTTLYWSVFGGPNVTAADFTESSGSFVITSDAGAVTVGISADYVTEGQEFFYLEIKTVSVSGNVVGTSRSVFINDTAFTFFFEITGLRTGGTNLRSQAIAAGWDQVQRLECQVDHQAECIGNGTSIATYNRTDNPVKHRDVCGMEITGAYPNGLILRNNGLIQGRGGAGGAGALSAINQSGSNGGAGGPGLVIVSGTTASFITVINAGRISGGGGGGGGGGVYLDDDGTTTQRGSGGGGGQPFGPGGGGRVAGATATVRLPGAGGLGPSTGGGFGSGGAGRLFAESGFLGGDSNPGGGGLGGFGGLGGIGIVGRNSITNFIQGNLSGGVLGAPGVE